MRAFGLLHVTLDVCIQ